MFKSVRFDGLFRASSFRRLLLFARPCAVIGMLVCDKLTQHSAGADCAGVASEQHWPHRHDVLAADLRLLASDHRLVLFLELLFDADSQFCLEPFVLRMTCNYKRQTRKRFRWSI